jgi:2-iminobutanoate/2-iminopropanoate deaminase
MVQATAHGLDGPRPNRCAYILQWLLVNVHEHSRFSTIMKESISLDGIVTYAPYTPGIRHGQHFWLSGQIAIDGDLDIKSQTKGALAKIDALLEAGGLSKNDICFAQVLLDTIEDYGAMNEVYGAWVADMDMPPARAAFEAGALPKGALVEIVVQGITS